MIAKLINFVKLAIDPRKWLVALFADNAVGSALRIVFVYVGGELVKGYGFRPDLIDQWIEINIQVTAGLAAIALAYLADRFNLPIKR